MQAQPWQPQVWLTHTEQLTEGMLAQKREYKAQGKEKRKISLCYMPLTRNGIKVFHRRGSGKSCESLSKLILAASQN